MSEFILSEDEKALVLARRKENATKSDNQARFDSIMAKSTGAWTPEETDFIGEQLREQFTGPRGR